MTKKKHSTSKNETLKKEIKVLSPTNKLQHYFCDNARLKSVFRVT